MRRLIFLLMATFVLAACSSGADSEQSVPQAATVVPAAEADEAAEAEPDPTAAPPTSEPTAVPTIETPTAEPSVEPTEAVALDTAVSSDADEAEMEGEGEDAADEAMADMAEVPELVWLPYSSGTYGNPVLTVRDGEIIYEEEPDTIEAFFDYANGRIAFGMEFWYAADNGLDAVTDLWVYDYAVDESELWLDGNVARAAWSPVDKILAVAVHNGTDFDLALMTAAEEWVILNKDIDPFYSWSPDGEQIAFVRDGELFVTTLDGMESPSLTSNMYQESGWVGDAPLWLLDYELLAYADFPVTFVSLDGVEVYEPIAADGDALDVSKRALQMLWSDSQQQLIMQYEGMFGPSVQIFQFADDIYTVDEVHDLGEGHQLVGWYEGNENIIILQNGEPQIYSLLTHEMIAP